jgi:hypothetical protein
MSVPLVQEKDESQLVDGTDTRYTFIAWNDSLKTNNRTVMLISDTTFTALTKVEYKVQIESSPAGIAYPDSGGWFENGTTREIIVNKVEGFKLVNWQLNGALIAATDTLTLKINGPKKVVAVYVKPVYSLTFLTDPPENLTVQMNLLSVISPVTTIQNAATIVPVSIPSVQEKDNSVYVSGNDTRYVFSSWYDKDTTKSRSIQQYQRHSRYFTRLKRIRRPIP